MAKKEDETKALTRVDKKRIDEAVEHINQLYVESVHKATIEVGEYVLDEFFDGDPAKVKSKDPNKEASFRALEDRCGEDLVLSRSGLHRAVNVAIQFKELEGSVPALGQLSASHQVALLPLPENEQKIDLAKKAIKGKWTSRKLQEEVDKLRRALPPSGRGRPPLALAVKFANKVERLAQELPELDDLGAADVPEVVEKIEATIHRLEQLRDQLKAHKLAEAEAGEGEASA